MEALAEAGAASYLLEVDDDPAFSTPAYSQTVDSNSHTPNVDLPSNIVLYWRVRPSNTCGDGSFSAVFSFTTVALPGQPALALGPQEHLDVVELTVHAVPGRLDVPRLGSSAISDISGQSRVIDAEKALYLWRSTFKGQSKCRVTRSFGVPRLILRYRAFARFRIAGVKQSTIIRYWANVGGSTGTYRGKTITHVDIGPIRSWRW